MFGNSPKIFSPKVLKRHQRRRKFFRLLKITGVAIIFASALVLLAAKAEFLEIKQIVVQGLGPASLMDKQVLLERLKTYLSAGPFGFRRNLITLQAERARYYLTSEFPVIAQVKFSRNFSQGILKLDLTLQKRAAVWCYFEECFLVNKHGFIYATFREDSDAGFKIQDVREALLVKIGQFIEDPQVLKTILEIKQGLEDLKISPLKAVIHKESLVFEGPSGQPALLFYEAEPVSGQLAALKAALEAGLRQRLRDLNYLDLRSPGRIYYQ
jgi:hypothetical protein